jgi:gamma-glutamyltranspeptidase
MMDGWKRESKKHFNEMTDFSRNVLADGTRLANAEGKALAVELANQGYQVEERSGENSGIHLINVTPRGLDGAADKRREGIVRTTP